MNASEYVAARLTAGDAEGAILAADEQYAIGCLRAAQDQELNDAWPEAMQQGFIDALEVLAYGPLPGWTDFLPAWAMKEETP